MELVFLFAAFAVGYLAGRWHTGRSQGPGAKTRGGGGPGEE